MQWISYFAKVAGQNTETRAYLTNSFGIIIHFHYLIWSEHSVVRKFDVCPFASSLAHLWDRHPHRSCHRMSNEDVQDSLSARLPNNHYSLFRGGMSGFESQLMFCNEFDHLLHFRE